MHERYRQTDRRQTDRQTDDRQTTDGRATAYSEREREFTFAKNQDNPIKTVGRDSYLSPKTPKNTSFLGVTQPQGSQSPYILGDTTRPRHITYVLV